MDTLGEHRAQAYTCNGSLGAKSLARTKGLVSEVPLEAQNVSAFDRQTEATNLHISPYFARRRVKLQTLQTFPSNPCKTQRICINLMNNRWPKCAQIHPVVMPLIGSALSSPSPCTPSKVATATRHYVNTQLEMQTKKSVKCKKCVHVIPHKMLQSKLSNTNMCQF